MTQDAVTRHEGTAEATRHEGTADATRHEGTADATRHEGTADAGAAYFQLPAGILAEHDFIRLLSRSGGQADILLCRDRARGEEVVVKLYRGHVTIDRSAYDKLSALSPRHVTPILDLRTEEDGTWEVQEYFRHGSLLDLVRQRGGGPQPEDFVRDVVSELCPAIQCIHAAHITHRDLKPGNIFVRTVDELDLVIGDFGFARDVAMSHEFMSVVGVFHYMAPEMLVGEVSPAADWWALGVIVFELLTGHTPFLDDTGTREANPNAIRGSLHRGTYSISEVTEPRWNLLLRGLLNRSRQHRWSAAQVTEWLGGGTPEVVEVAETARPTAPLSPMTLPWGKYTDPSDAVASLAAHWQDAEEYLSRRGVTDLSLWLKKTEVGEAASALLREVGGRRLSVQTVLVDLQMLVRPGEPIMFQGRVVGADTLGNAAIHAAAGDTADQGWIRAVRTHQVLGTVANNSEDGPRLAAADLALRRHWQRLDTLLAAAAATPEVRDLVPEVRGRLEGLMLAVTLDASRAQDCLVRGRRVGARLTDRDPQLLRSWAAELASGSLADAVALDVLGRQSVEAREATERTREQQREAAERDRRVAIARQRAAVRGRELRNRVRRARNRIPRRIGMTAALVVFVMLPVFDQLNRTVGVTLAFTIAAPLFLSIGIAWVLESLVPLVGEDPPMVAYGLGLAAFLARAWATLPTVSGYPDLLELGPWVGWLFPWFVGGYTVGHGVALLMGRIRGPLGSGVNSFASVLPVMSICAVATVAIITKLKLPATQLGTGQLGLDAAGVLSIGGINALSALGMWQLGVVAAIVAIIALSTQGSTRRLPGAVQTLSWLILNAVCLLVVLFNAPVLALGFWLLLGVALVLGAASFVIAVVAS